MNAEWIATAAGAFERTSRLAMTIIIFLLITVQGKPRFSVARPYLRILAPQQFEFLRLYNKFALDIAKRKTKTDFSKQPSSAVLPSEMSFCIKSKSGDRSNGTFLTVAEKRLSNHGKINSQNRINFS